MGSGLWPWLAVAGMGALHGLNPASGWMWVAASGLRSPEAARPWRALGLVAAGHAASVALVAAAVAFGLSNGRGLLQASAAVLLLALVAAHLWRGRTKRVRRPMSRVGLPLCAFIASTVHGTGLMLVPALVPLCLAGTPAREITASGSMLLALAAVGAHATAMLCVSGVMASGACRLARACGAWRRGGIRHAHAVPQTGD